MPTVSTSLRELRWALATLAAGLLLTVALAWQLHRFDEARIQSALADAADQYAERLVERIRLYQYGLGGTHAAIQAVGSGLRRDLLARFSRTLDLEHEFPGVRGFGFIRRVPVADEEAFLARARADGWPEFAIRQLAPHGDERFVIQYIEPVERNRQAVGLDIASESRRRQAALAAMRTGQVRLTGPITLVQATGNPLQSFLMLMPVYEGGVLPESVEAREARCLGWSYAPLLAAEVMAGLQPDPRQLRMRLADATEPGEPVPFFDSVTKAGDPPGLARVTVERTLHGRRWQMSFEAYPAFVASLALTPPSLVLGIGSLVSLLLALLVAARRSASRRRRELRLGRARLAAMVDSSTDAIIGVSLDGRVTSWNPGARALFGYAAEEAVGQALQALVVPGRCLGEAESLQARIVAGESVAPFETLRRRQDGSLVEVSVSGAPIRDAQGAVIAASITVRDISRQKAQQAEILALNSRLERQVEERTLAASRLNRLLGNVLRSASEVAIIATDTEGRIDLFNTGAERLLGYPAEAMLGRGRLLDFHLEEELRAHGQALAGERGAPVEGLEVLLRRPREQGAEVREWTYRHRDGALLTVSLAITAMRDERGEPEGYLAIAIDISERKATERSLAASLALTRAILDTAVNPIFTLDAEGRLTSFNPAAERVFGYRAGEATGRPLSTLVAEPLEGLLRALAASAADADADGGVEGVQREVMALRADGGHFPASLSLGAMRVDGEVRVVAVLVDVTEQRRQREALTAARDQLALAAQVAGLGVWSWNPLDDRLQWNERMFELYGQPASVAPMLDRPCWRCWVHPEDRPRLDAALEAVVRGAVALDLVLRVLTRGGAVLEVHAAAQAERDAQGRVVRVTGIHHDITAQRELERHLRLAKEEADAASAAKSSFLANVSHEIRTPMNAVLGMLQLLGQTELGALQRDYLGTAHDAARSLLGLLNDVLDYSKIEAGKLQLDPHPFELDRLLRDLAAVVSGNLGQKEDLEIVFDVAPDLPSALVGDSLRLQQVLINLAGNALKFTAQGQVIIEVAARERDARSVALRFAVADTGIGISPEQLEHIFEGFRQAEASTSRRFGGTGLGLGICRRLVGLMGGALQVESRPGQGSRFWFDIRLPIARGEPMVAPGPRGGPRLLLAEDNLRSAEVFTRTLAVAGWQVEHVAEGGAAIERAMQAERAGRPFDAALVDWSLPALGGLAVANFLRLRPTPMPLLISACNTGGEALPEARRRPDRPFDGVLAKPVSPRQLVEGLARAMARREPPPAPAAARRGRRLEGLRLLVVEDNVVNRQVAAELLGREGAEVVLAEGGLAGVEQVLGDAQGFDVVIMDVQMPDIDGLEATRRIRALPRFADLPILAMTANVAMADRQACLAAGMNDHIGKPIDLDAMVVALLALAGRRRPAGRAPAADEAGGDAEVEPIEAIARRFGGDLRLYGETLARFESDARVLLDELEQQLRQDRLASAEAVLHALKGTAGTVGALALARAAAALAGLLDVPDEDTAARARACLPRLREHLDSALRQLSCGAGEPVAPPPAAPAGLDETARRALLEELLPLLKSGNMQALALVDRLAAATPQPAGPWIELAGRIRSLDFPGALAIARLLLENR